MSLTPKRKACASCIGLKIKCTKPSRPCEQCIHRGIVCSDVPRKPRRKTSELSRSMQSIANLQSSSGFPFQLVPFDEVENNTLSTPTSTSPFLPPVDVSSQQSSETTTLDGTQDAVPNTHEQQILSTPCTLPMPALPQITNLLHDLYSVLPFLQSIQTHAALPLLNVVAKLIYMLEMDRTQEVQMVSKVQGAKQMIDAFLCAQKQSLPKEIQITVAIFSVDPQTVQPRDCNESFVKIFNSAPVDKRQLMNANMQTIFKPFLWKLVIR
eukprot:Phypoly_transcript_07516.p1 GENE.Phypoly_transcript_07516~~Phypoly_transcript_07516.p1  ORF type:complete len:267 (+),score=29.82 Phypoly_transcript_07516:214-1014(+)